MVHTLSNKSRFNSNSQCDASNSDVEQCRDGAETTLKSNFISIDVEINFKHKNL